MRTNPRKRIAAAAVVTALFCCGTKDAAAQVSFNMNVNLGPPPVVVAPPPEVVLIPSYGVYFLPGVSFDILFYNGYWWSPRGDRWYRASGYNGPWRAVSPRYVPRPVLHVPHDYRRVYAGEHHIPYGEWSREHGRHGAGRGHGGGEHGSGGEHRGGGRGGHGGDRYEGGEWEQGGGHGRH